MSGLSSAGHGTEAGCHSSRDTERDQHFKTAQQHRWSNGPAEPAWVLGVVLVWILGDKLLDCLSAGQLLELRLPQVLTWSLFLLAAAWCLAQPEYTLEVLGPQQLRWTIRTLFGRRQSVHHLPDTIASAAIVVAVAPDEHQDDFAVRIRLDGRRYEFRRFADQAAADRLRDAVLAALREPAVDDDQGPA